LRCYGQNAITEMIKDVSMTDSYELQGEMTSLCCFVGALASTLPLSSQMRLWPAFEQKDSQLRDQLSQEALRGFELATISLSSKRG
jgi:hypothetical protein